MDVGHRGVIAQYSIVQFNVRERTERAGVNAYTELVGFPHSKNANRQAISDVTTRMANQTDPLARKSA